jgi:hypothetical protein
MRSSVGEDGGTVDGNTDLYQCTPAFDGKTIDLMMYAAEWRR